jgi:hypothetical protein
LATQWPVDEQASSGLQPLVGVHAAIQLPAFPLTAQVQGPPGPQTIGCGGAASPMTAQSESVLHGDWGAAQMPQPE